MVVTDDLPVAPKKADLSGSRQDGPEGVSPKAAGGPAAADPARMARSGGRLLAPLPR